MLAHPGDGNGTGNPVLTELLYCNDKIRSTLYQKNKYQGANGCPSCCALHVYIEF